MSKRRLGLALTAVVTCARGGPGVLAVDLHDVLADYAVASWTQQDGLSSAVWAITQDEDNYLWLGTDDGLTRFDGVRFVPWAALNAEALPSRPIRALWTARDRSLWIGFDAGGLVRVRGGRIREFGEADGIPSSFVLAFAEDRSNTLWAATSVGLFKLTNDTWERVSGTSGLPQAAAFSVYVDAAGTVIAAVSTGMFQRREGADRFEPIEAETDVVRDVSV